MQAFPDVWEFLLVWLFFELNLEAAFSFYLAILVAGVWPHASVERR